MLPFILALAAAVQVPASPAAPPTQDRQIAMTASLGTILFALDRAAWVASDALNAKLPKDQLTGVGGWVVERDEGDVLVVTFYRGQGDAARALFTADVRAGKVVDSRPAPADTALTPAQHRLARARDAAAQEAVARGYRPCTAAPFNTVVVPSSNPQAPTLVYLLSAQVAAGTYPMGGHYRVVVGPDGRVTGSRPFSKSCLNMPVPRASGGQRPAGLFVSHVLDPVPTETHVFTSLSAGLPLFVGAGGKVWSVNGRTITVSDIKPPAPPR
ncbi:MAG: hypothetical protein V4537_15165 [Pseudomonadota bacterium]